MKQIRHFWEQYRFINQTYDCLPQERTTLAVFNKTFLEYRFPNCWSFHKASFLGFTIRWVIICSTVCNILMATDYVWNCLLCVSVLCKVRIIWRQPVLTALHEVSLTYDFTWSAIYKTITRRSQYTLHLVKFKTADVHVVAMHNLYFKKNFQGILETMISNAF